ncbi:putative oxidoreductase [Posidoniimonas corsicana]|uniref:Putative oxidoreductase n=1 Tax=Posidoniimonas corsicana TaxID=1938618 RepID=A0A5C5VHM5_9BACT|nr:aldo/keto reductase [Posidoniimonas corsicana]TWT38134.1 putative oxidoreductase [Posidoniimonas corsicana]
MIYRSFGRTELNMPVISCGGMRYQQTWDDALLDVVEDENQRNLEATIRRAVELGVNHIETARGYGTSERQLGLVLPKLPRDEIIVQTKIAPEADPEVFRKHCLESLERLNLDCVDLLGLHGINNYKLHWHAVRPGGCLEVARQLQAEGKVRHVGFSTHGLLPQILDTINTDACGGFDYVNLHWYYISQWNWPAVQAATARDMGVFIISPNDKGGLLYKPSDKLVELCQPLHPIVFNTLFCLRRPEVHTLSLGAARPSDFDLQLSAMELVPKADELVAPIVEKLERALFDATGFKADAVLTQSLTKEIPAWDQDAPGYMNAPMVLWLRNLALAFDMVEYGKMRYNLLGRGGHWFPGLSAAHLDTLDDEQLAKAFKKSPHADKIVGWLREAEDLLGGEAVKRLSQE